MQIDRRAIQNGQACIRRRWRLLKFMPAPRERLCRIAHISMDVSTAMFWRS